MVFTNTNANVQVNPHAFDHDRGVQIIERKPFASSASHPIAKEITDDLLAQVAAEKQAAADLDARLRAEPLRPRDGHTILGKVIEYALGNGVNSKK